MFYIMTLSFLLQKEKMPADAMKGKTSRETVGSIRKDTPPSTDISTPTKPFMHRWLKLTDFSIENILRKDFGRTIQKHANRHSPRHLSIRCHTVNQLTVENIFRSRATIECCRRKTGDSVSPVSPAISPTNAPPIRCHTVNQLTVENIFKRRETIECCRRKTGDSVSLVSPAISPTNAAEQQLSETSDEGQEKTAEDNAKTPLLWPAWVYCTRYSDRPSSGPRTRKIRARRKKDEKRPRTAFSAPQLQRLRQEFRVCNYLTEERRRSLAMELFLSESQIKIWFQNKRAKIKKAHGYKNPLAVNLMSQGLYNHSTISLQESSDETSDKFAKLDQMLPVRETPEDRKS